MDIVFSNLTKILDYTDIDDLYKNISGQLEPAGDPRRPVNIPSSSLPDNGLLDSAFGERYRCISYLLDQLVEIKNLAVRYKTPELKDTLMISLHDMSTFGKLVTCIVVQGVYASLPQGIGISLEKRSLKHGSRGPAGKLQNNTNRFRLLQVIVNKMLVVFQLQNDVHDLLLKGVGYSDLLVSVLYLASTPELPDSGCSDIFKQVEDYSPSFELFEVYSLLLKGSPVWFRQVCMSRLSMLPYERNLGVQGFIEYATGMRYNEEVNIEKINNIIQILLNKPKSLTTVSYFEKVSQQMYVILAMNRPILTAVVVGFLEALRQRNSRVFVDFYLTKIWTTANPGPQNCCDYDVVVNGATLANNVRVIISIVKNTSDKGLLDLLFRADLVVSLWNYYLFNKAEIVKLLFQWYFNVSENTDALLTIIDNTLIGLNNFPWIYGYELADDTSVVCIKYESIETKEFKLALAGHEEVFSVINSRVDTLLEFIEFINNQDFVQLLFISILKRWLIKLEKHVLEDNSMIDSFKTLINLRLLESLSAKFKKLITADNINEILDVIIVVLDERQDQQDNDDGEQDSDDEEVDDSSLRSYSLQFLSTIVTEKSTKLFEPKIIEKLKQISTKLIFPETAELKSSIDLFVADNSLFMQKLQDKSKLNDQEMIKKLTINQEKFENDMKVFDLAMERLNDTNIVIKVQGLQAIGQLVSKNSKIVSVKDAISIYWQELDSNEPFVYLNVIKGLGKLLDTNLQQALPEVLERYDNESSVDSRVKLGEAITNLLLKYSPELLSSKHALVAFPDALLGQLMLTTINIVKITNKKPLELRVLALAIISVCFKVQLSVHQYLADVLDLLIGIFTFELSMEEKYIRRAAITLLHDIVGSNVTLQEFPSGYGKRLWILLSNLKTNDADLLIREQISDTLEYIKEVFRGSLIG